MCVCVCGPVLVDGVADDERGQQEEGVAGLGALRLQVYLVDGDHLPLRRGGLLHHLGGAQDRDSSTSGFRTAGGAIYSVFSMSVL